MSEAVIHAILWFVSIGVGEFLIFFTLFLGATLLAERIDRVWPVFIGAALGWILAVGWFIFAGYHVVMNIVVIIQLLLE